jgi:hypothetical protein
MTTQYEQTTMPTNDTGRGGWSSITGQEDAWWDGWQWHRTNPPDLGNTAGHESGTAELALHRQRTERSAADRVAPRTGHLSVVPDFVPGTREQEPSETIGDAAVTSEPTVGVDPRRDVGAFRLLLRRLRQQTDEALGGQG